MNDVDTINFHDFVMLSGDKLVTDSCKVAKHFGKPHKTVLRAFDNVGCSAEFNRRNFVPIEYIDGRGRRQRAIEMTKDGFFFLALGFTGAKADVVREEYINAFNAMSEHIKRNGMSGWMQKQALILEERNSKAWGSYGSRLMLTRKKEIPKFSAEHQRLDNIIQPSLQFMLN